MNETDFLRRQLTTERAHLREILEALAQRTVTGSPSQPVVLYVDWAARRLLHQFQAQCSAMQAGAAAGIEALRPLHVQTERLLALIDALALVEASLDARMQGRLGVSHWRQAAQLNADTILQERQLYAAARGAVGLS